MRAAPWMARKCSRRWREPGSAGQLSSRSASASDSDAGAGPSIAHLRAGDSLQRDGLPMKRRGSAALVANILVDQLRRSRFDFEIARELRGALAVFQRPKG